MRTRLILSLLVVCALGGGGFYAVRSHLRDANPAVKAERLANEGRLREALVEMRNASRAEPKDGGLHLRIGQILSKLADPVAAEKEFRTALQLGADRGAVAPELGEAMLVQGRFRDLLREVQPRGAGPAAVSRLLLLRAVAQLSLDDLPAARQTLADAEARAPGQADTALIGARIAAAGNDLPGMREKVAEVLRLDPNQVEALLMQEKLMVMAGDRAEALRLADRAVKAAPWSAMARIERASQHMFGNEDAKAQADVDAVLQAQPRFMDAVYLNGLLMARRGLLTEASAQLDKLENVSARLPQGLYYQSFIALQQGNLQTAAEFARRYNALVPQDPDGTRALAQLELALGRPAAALPLMTKLTAEQPKDVEALDMLGRAYAALNRPPEAGRAFEAALALAPDRALVRYHLGAQQLQTGRAGDAVTSLETAFAADPRIAGLGTSLVGAHLANGDPAAAEGALARVRAATGDTEELTLLAAQIRLRQGDAATARTLLADGIRKYPTATELRVQMAQVLIQEGRPMDAQPILAAILGKEPAKLSALSAFIELRAVENDMPGAVKALDAAHRAAPRNAAITSMLSDALIAAKEPQRAVDTIREGGVDSALPPLLAAALGRAQVALGRMAEAKATYRAALAEHPEDLMLRGAMTALLSSEGDYAAVQASLQEALALRPGNFSLLSGLVANEARWKGMPAAARLAEELRAQPGAMPAGAELRGDLFMAANQQADAARAYGEDYAATPTRPLLIKASGAMALANRVEDAITLVRAALTASPNDPDLARRLAQLEIQAGRHVEAQASLAVVLAARPNDASALNNLAWSYLMTGDGRALPTAQRAYLQDPSALAGDTLGWALVKSGSARAAIPLLQRAVEQRPDRGTLFHLAVALAEDGRKGEALRTLQPLLTGPSFPDQDAARRLADGLKPD